MKNKCEVWCPYKQGALTVGEIKDYLKQRIKHYDSDYKHTNDEKLKEYLEGKINADSHLLAWIINRERYGEATK